MCYLVNVWNMCCTLKDIAAGEMVGARDARQHLIQDCHVQQQDGRLDFRHHPLGDVLTR